MAKGTIELAVLRLRAAPTWGRWLGVGEMAFILLLSALAKTGPALLAASTGTVTVRPRLVSHLAAMISLFLLRPSSRMIHSFFRFRVLVAEMGRLERTR
ncbi:hypothetical protein E4191_23190 (plasmid) [Paracoccus liaowanqingii]|uniref:Uncharacterized protein n=1 Tax=Paracoccus liaowanqingii TaxID=2560053 RepID=A0A4Y5SUC0_9RHOB|nr:hypothetical protein [Paracoccus liaowanqingii]QDA36949.1 hypothetical protein E4191_23190 [Paracoccus liaowanqingii]